MREELKNHKAIEEFGLVIKRKRQKKNLSQDELAAKANMDRAYLSLIESGKKQPTLSTIFNICDSLEIKVSMIMAEVEKGLQR